MIRPNFKRLLTAASFALTVGVGGAQAAPTVALYLTMDGSGSIDAAEFTLQVTAYNSALNAVFAADPSLYGKVAIGGGIFGATFAQFYAVQSIDDAGDLLNLTNAISALNPGRAGINTGATAIGDAITLSANALTAYETSLGANIKLLIDVTTDGANNLGSNPATVANALTPAPLDAVNCLGIGAGADCSFVTGAGTNFGQVSFATLDAALTQKLQQEFRTPEPGALALLGLGLVGLATTRRRKP